MLFLLEGKYAADISKWEHYADNITHRLTHYVMKNGDSLGFVLRKEPPVRPIAIYS
jgi:hypothetical protein